MLEFDDESNVLASNIGWARAFSQQFSDVLIYATRVGNIPQDLPTNIEVHEIGGGSKSKRVKALGKLSYLTFMILVQRKKVQVFHHMIHKTVIFPGFLFRMVGVKQILWYSHSVAGKGLSLAAQIVNHIVAPTRQSFPLSEYRVAKGLGQAIDVTRLVPKTFSRDLPFNFVKVSSIGRVNRIKNLNKLLEALSTINTDIAFQIEFTGPVQDVKYRSELVELATAKSLNLKIFPPVKYGDIALTLRDSLLYFSGTVAAVDRAAIEAAICGCLIVSENLSLLELSGMTQLWHELGRNPGELRLKDQIVLLSLLDNSVALEFSEKVSQFAKKRNDVRVVVSQIIDLFSIGAD